VLLAPAPAWALDVFEIQVYDGSINRVGQPGLELHTNFVANGRAAPEFPGEQVPDGSLHLTLEPSLGVLPWWELGAYLQFATAPARSQAHFGGGKLRSKLVVPRRYTGPFLIGLNLEVGRGVAALGSAEWESEFRPIFAWGAGRFFVAVNPIIGWSLTGQRSAVPDFEPCTKVQLDVGHQVGLGIEYYAGLGPLDAVPGFSRQQHVLYLAGDLLEGPIELNVGLGRGLSDATDRWTFKVIVGKVF
jgi:hypothetical protein